MIPLHFRPASPGDVPLEDGDIHLWRCRFSDLPDASSSWSEQLHDHELVRIESVSDVTRQSRVAASRIWLRRLLGAYLELEPFSIQLVTGPSGRPDLDSEHHRDGLSFNLSHSGELLLIALAKAPRIGVDIEQVCPRSSLERLAQRCFSDHERQTLAAAKSPLETFYRGWTRKEALHKAMGSGVFQGLSRTEVSLGDVFTPAIISISGDREQARQWQLLDVCPETNSIGAVAIEKGNWRLRPLALTG